MEKFYDIAERNKIIKSVCAFQRTFWYPMLLALLCAIGCGFDIDVPVVYIIAASTAFAALFNRDSMPLVVALLFTYFSLGLHADISDLDITHWTVAISLAQIIQLVICAVIMLAAMFYRLALDGKLKLGLRRGAFTYGLLAMGGAMLLGGAFFAGYNAQTLLMGAIVFASLFVIYYLMQCIFTGEKDVMLRLCRVCLWLAALIVVELAILFIKLNAWGLLISDGSIVRERIVLGWGVNNLIAGVLVITIAPIMYLAYREKSGALYNLAAVGVMIAIALTLCRSALLTGGLVYALSLVICCVCRGGNRRGNRIAAIAVASLAVVAAIIGLATGWLQTFFARFFVGGDFSNGRFDIWQTGLTNFTKNPVFGVGFAESAYPPTHDNYGTTFWFQNMYHNIGVQFIAATGVVGVLAFVWHMAELVRFYIVRRIVRQRNVAAAFVGLTLFTVLFSSVFDNFFFYPCVALIYATFLAASEVDDDAAVSEEFSGDSGQ